MPPNHTHEPQGEAHTEARRAAVRVTPIHVVVPGRARLGVAGLRRCEPVKRLLEEVLAPLEFVREISCSTLTGNVLVLYMPDTPLEEVVAWLEKALDDWPTTEQGGGVQPASAEERLTSWWSPAAWRLPYFKRSPARRPASEGHRRDQPQRNWHQLELAEALAHWGSSSSQGLDDAQAAARLAQYGPNRLRPPAARSALSILLEQFQSAPVAMLGISAAVSVVTGGVVDAVVIMAVVAINAVIGFVTESQAERTIRSLAGTVERRGVVLRGGVTREVAMEEIAPGDVLILRPGGYVCADGRLLEADDLSVDESALTGESLPVSKSPHLLPEGQIPLGDRCNMVYMGTVVTGGSGVMMVVATGRHTEIGRIQDLMGEARPPETPMEKQLDGMGRQMVWISSTICLAVFGVGLLRGYGLLEMLKASISLAVAAVPEGLPTVATTTLALGIAEMRRHKVVVRQLDAVETLGAVQVICLDKTGTLTMNRMSVVALYGAQGRVAVRNDQPNAGRKNDVSTSEDLLQLLRVAVLCSEAQVEGEGRLQQVIGSPTEAALVRVALGAGVDVGALCRRHPRLDVSYRGQGRNFMSTVHSAPDGSRLIAVKGSPAEVLARCTRYRHQGQSVPLDAVHRDRVLAENQEMAATGLRVLGVACREATDGESTLPDELVWLGLAAMADPTRDGVRELIGQFHRAGIDTIMITGDQSATAFAIGKELRLAGNGDLEILDSSHLEQVDPELLAALAKRVNIFARVSPSHKLRIVQALQASGQVVAMTGDGINDGPALRAADIGVAMGSAGTDAARTVADVVLEDDNLHTMIIAVSQGRTIYRNIRKSIRFLLSTNLSEIAVMLGAIAAGLGQPLNPMQLLWINLLSDVFPGLALAVEPAEPDLMGQPPRDPAQPILRREDLGRTVLEGSVISAAALGTYGYGVLRYGIGPRAGTLAFTSLTSAQLLHAITCRSDTHSIFSGRRLPPNPYLRLALAGSLGLQVLAIALPPLRRLLGTTPLSLTDALVAGAGATLPLMVNESIKLARAPPVPQRRES